MSTQSKNAKRNAQGSPFRPACPHCGSKDAVIDPQVKSNGWREYLVYAFMLLGAMTVTLYMRCNYCGEAFAAWKGVSREVEDVKDRLQSG